MCGHDCNHSDEINEHEQIARTILAQLGRMTQLMIRSTSDKRTFMLSSTSPTRNGRAIRGGVSFFITGAAKRKLFVELDGPDTYTVVVGHLKGMDWVTESVMDDVYAENLRDVVLSLCDKSVRI